MAEANIIKDYKIGNTRIKIADNCCIKNKEEVEKLLKKIAETVYRNINSAIEN